MLRRPVFGHHKAQFGGAYQAKLATPFAVLGIRVAGGKLQHIEYLPLGVAALAPTDALAEKTCRQIERYLNDSEYIFDLPFELAGTDFQQRVWREIAGIPTGKTRSYSELARRLGSGPRAVGGACGANRLPLVIPCHRVIAADGGLGGFMHARGGQPLDIKRWLLAHERRQQTKAGI